MQEIQFCFPASMIAAVAGRNKYRDRYSALAEVLHSYNSKLLPIPESNRLLPKEYVDKLAQGKDEDSIYELLINSDISPDAKEEAISYSTRINQMRRGIRLEDETFQKLKNCGYNIQKSRVCFKRSFGYNNRHTIVGRVDGVICDENNVVTSVVEIKNRKDFFFTPGYDLDQLASYVFMTGAKDGLLVQQLHGEIQVTYYDGNDLLGRWDMIITDLKKMITFARKIVKNPSGKEWDTLKKKFVFCK